MKLLNKIRKISKLAHDLFYNEFKQRKVFETEEAKPLPVIGDGDDLSEPDNTQKTQLNPLIMTKLEVKMPYILDLGNSEANFYLKKFSSPKNQSYLNNSTSGLNSTCKIGVNYKFNII